MTLRSARSALVHDRWSTIVDDLTVGSLFSGFGALDQAVRDVLGGGRLMFVSDVKPAAVRLLAHRHPDVPNIGDFAALFPAIGPLTAEALAMPPTDVVAAGWPCQPHSSAGKRLGMEDPRALWPNVIRYISEKRPAIFFGENVARITTNGELRRVIRSLAAIGYVGAWRVLRASDVGAAHRRERCFVVAVDATSDAARELVVEIASGADGVFGERASVGRRQQFVSGLGGSGEPAREGAAGQLAGRRRTTSGDPTDSDVATSLSLLPTPRAGDSIRGAHDDGRQTRAAAQGRARPTGASLPTVISLLPTPAERLGDGRGFPSESLARARMDSGRRNLDDAVALLPTPKASDGEKGGPNMRGSSGDLALPSIAVQLLPTPTARDAGRGAGWGDQPGRPLSETVHRIPGAGPAGAHYSAAEWGVYAEALARWHAVCGHPAPAPTQVGSRNGRPQLSPYFVEWLMGVEPGWVTGVPDLTPRASGWRNACLSLLGDGVVRLQAATAFRFLLAHLAGQLAAEVAA